MQQILLKNKYCHCDVKPANLVILNFMILLIDADTLENFGAQREFYTEGENISATHA